MNIKEIRGKSVKELNKLLFDQREKLRDLNFKLESKQTKSVRDIRKTKKSIAQILTVIKEKELNKDKKKVHKKV